MEHVEVTAISNSLHPPRWWFRYVDDCHACLQKQHIQEFHGTVNAVNPHIQFTIEVSEENNRLSFLDTLTTRKNGRVQVQVYRKPTLTIGSHHPTQHKQSVVNTLLDRADKIISTNVGKRRERKHVPKVLTDNNYPCTFVKMCVSRRKSSPPPSEIPDASTDTQSSQQPNFVGERRKGGLKMCNFAIMEKALKIAWIKRIQNEGTSSWKIIADVMVQQYGNLFFLSRCNYDPKMLSLENLSSFYR